MKVPSGHAQCERPPPHALAHPGDRRGRSTGGLHRKRSRHAVSATCPGPHAFGKAKGLKRTFQSPGISRRVQGEVTMHDGNICVLNVFASGLCKQPHENTDIMDSHQIKRWNPITQLSLLNGFYILEWTQDFLYFSGKT